MKNITLVAIISLLLLQNFYSQSADKNFIVVEVESRLDFPASDVAFTITLEAADTIALSAHQKLKEIESSFMGLIKEFNINDTCVSYSLIYFRKDGGYNQKIKYLATKTVNVILSNISQYESFQIALLNHGIYSFAARFFKSDVSKLKAESYEKTLIKAKKEANILASKTGRSLGKVLEIESSNREIIIPPDITVQSIAVRGVDQDLINLPQVLSIATRLKVKFELE